MEGSFTLLCLQPNPTSALGARMLCSLAASPALQPLHQGFPALTSSQQLRGFAQVPRASCFSLQAFILPANCFLFEGFSRWRSRNLSPARRGW